MVCPTLPPELQALVMEDWFRALHQRTHRRKFAPTLRFFAALGTRDTLNMLWHARTHKKLGWWPHLIDVDGPRFAGAWPKIALALANAPVTLLFEDV